MKTLRLLTRGGAETQYVLLRVGVSFPSSAEIRVIATSEQVERARCSTELAPMRGIAEREEALHKARS